MYEVRIWQGRWNRCYGIYESKSQASEVFDLLVDMKVYDGVELVANRGRKILKSQHN